MSDGVFALGFFAATLLPALAALWLVRRWRRDGLGTLLAVLLAFGVAWLGMGLYVRATLGDSLAVQMD